MKMGRGRLRVSMNRSTPLHLNDEVENTSFGSQVPLEIDITPCQMTTQGPSNASCKCTFNMNKLCYCIDYEQTTSPKILTGFRILSYSCYVQQEERGLNKSTKFNKLLKDGRPIEITIPPMARGLVGKNASHLVGG